MRECNTRRGDIIYLIEEYLDWVLDTSVGWAMINFKRFRRYARRVHGIRFGKGDFYFFWQELFRILEDRGITYRVERKRKGRPKTEQLRVYVSIPRKQP